LRDKFCDYVYVCVYVYVCCEDLRTLLEVENEKRSNVGNVYGNS